MASQVQTNLYQLVNPQLPILEPETSAYQPVNPQFPSLEPETSVYQILNPSVESKGTSIEMRPQQRLTLDDDSLRKRLPTCEDDHMRNDHDASSPAIRIYDVCQYHQGEIEQVGVEQEQVHHSIVWQREPSVSERMSGQEFACEDNNVRSDHDATSHAIGIHDVSQHHKWETNQIEVDIGLRQEQETKDEVKKRQSRNKDEDGTLTIGSREYWRPSYMFHWLKCIGGNVADAYKHFEQYKGQQSHEELQPQPPTPMEEHDDGNSCSEWSHVSDYDEFGQALEEVQETTKEVSKTRRTWSHNQQAYMVKQWGRIGEDEEIGEISRVQQDIACIIK